MQDTENKTVKDVTDQYTGPSEDVPEDELTEEPEQEETSRVDLTQIGLDSDKIGGLTAWGMSYLVARPPEVQVDGKTYNLRKRYINSAKNDFAQLADNLGVEQALQQLDMGELSPGQILGLYAGLGGFVVMKQKREFKKEVKQLKEEMKEERENKDESKT